jgi:hypothetical protein
VEVEGTWDRRDARFRRLTRPIGGPAGQAVEPCPGPEQWQPDHALDAGASCHHVPARPLRSAGGTSEVELSDLLREAIVSTRVMRAAKKLVVAARAVVRGEQ